MTSSTIGLAVIGAGRIGAVHVRSVARHVPGAELVGISDVDLPAAQRLADDVGIGRVADVQSFLDDPAVRGVIIATPTDTHAGLIDRALQAGKHILCEKPISLRIAETNAADIAARSAGVVLQVGFQRRFDPEFSRARSIVQNGELGHARFLRLVGRDHRVPSLAYLRTSGGQFTDQMVHEFDLARWLLSPLEVEEVYATGSALIAPALGDFGDVDTSVVVLRFSGGVIGVIDNSVRRSTATTCAARSRDRRAWCSSGTSGSTAVGCSTPPTRHRRSSRSSSASPKRIDPKFGTSSRRSTTIALRSLARATLWKRCASR